ncbi:hypothetical protein KIN20_022508, partial [Parelaphostrongylus tenuis]
NHLACVPWAFTELENNMKKRLDRRRRAAVAVFGPLKKPPKQAKDSKTSCLNHFDSNGPSRRSAMQLRHGLILRPRQDCYEQLTERFERFFLKFSWRTQHLAVLALAQSFGGLFHPRDPQVYTSYSETRVGGSTLRRTGRQMGREEL